MHEKATLRLDFKLSRGFISLGYSKTFAGMAYLDGRRFGADPAVYEDWIISSKVAIRFQKNRQTKGTGSLKKEARQRWDGRCPPLSLSPATTSEILS